VVDTYASRPSVTAKKEFIFDVLRQSRERTPTAGTEDGDGGDVHSLDSSVHRLSADLAAIQRNNGDPYAPPRIVNRFPDNHARSRPSTTSGLANQPAGRANGRTTTRAGRSTARDAARDTTAAGRAKRIDFQKLFVDQPEVGYFPAIKATSQNQAREAHEAIARENDWLDEFLPPGSRASTASYPAGAPGNMMGGDTSLPRSRPSTGVRGSFIARPSTSAGSVSRPGTAACALAGTASRPGTSASFRPLDAEMSQAQLEERFGQQFAGGSGASISSASYLTDSRSVAHNKAASVGSLFVPLQLNCADLTCKLCVTPAAGALAASEIIPDGSDGEQDGVSLLFRDSDQPREDQGRIAQEDVTLHIPGPVQTCATSELLSQSAQFERRRITDGL
jgi:hypothetical protein